MGMFSSGSFHYPYSSEAFEVPRAPAKQGMVLSFMIPDAPYSDALFERIHKGFDIIEGVHATTAIFGIEIAGLLGVSLEVLGPLAGFAASLMAIGAGYAKAREIVARRAMISGFAHGVAMGADRRTWKYAKEMFWQNNPYRYDTPMDDAIRKIGQKSFNMGLASGFVQGRHLTEPGKPATQQERFFWKSIGQSLSPGDRIKYGGDSKLWSKNLWSDWYIRVAASFIALYAKESE
jgi:hypothetical protein